MTVLLALGIISMSAQDIHWAHIHASPTYLNPAMTGVIAKGDIRFIANARSQWNSFTKGYKTVMASSDMKLAPAGESGFIGGGINLFADQAGDLDFTTTKAGLAFSVVKALDRKGENLVSLGFQGDWFRQSIDYSKMFGFEEETIAFDGTPNNTGYFDMSVGAAWYYQFQWHSSFYVGASYSHITPARCVVPQRCYQQPRGGSALFPKTDIAWWRRPSFGEICVHRPFGHVHEPGAAPGD